MVPATPFAYPTRKPSASWPGQQPRASRPSPLGFAGTYLPNESQLAHGQVSPSDLDSPRETEERSLTQLRFSGLQGSVYADPTAAIISVPGPAKGVSLLRCSTGRPARRTELRPAYQPIPEDGTMPEGLRPRPPCVRALGGASLVRYRRGIAVVAGSPCRRASFAPDPGLTKPRAIPSEDAKKKVGRATKRLHPALRPCRPAAPPSKLQDGWLPASDPSTA